METVQVQMLETKDSLQKGNKYFLPEDLAETFEKNGIAVILILPGSEDVRSSKIGPKEFKTEAPPVEDEPKPEPKPKLPPPAKTRNETTTRPAKHVAPVKHPRR